MVELMKWRRHHLMEEEAPPHPAVQQQRKRRLDVQKKMKMTDRCSCLGQQKLTMMDDVLLLPFLSEKERLGQQLQQKHLAGQREKGCSSLKNKKNRSSSCYFSWSLLLEQDKVES